MRAGAELRAQRLRARLEHAAVERALLAGQLAVALVDDLRRQLGQHLRFRAAQHERTHETLQRRPVVDVLRQIAGDDEVEQRLQLALVVLDRRAGEADGDALVDRAERVVRRGVGVLDGLHLVEDDEIEAPAAELLDARAHEAVRRQRDRHVRARSARACLSSDR